MYHLNITACLVCINGHMVKDLHNYILWGVGAHFNLLYHRSSRLLSSPSHCPLCFSSSSSSGTYFTHEAKGADDAADADTAIINAEGGHTNSDEKKEYYI